MLSLLGSIKHPENGLRCVDRSPLECFAPLPESIGLVLFSSPFSHYAPRFLFVSRERVGIFFFFDDFDDDDNDDADLYLGGGHEEIDGDDESRAEFLCPFCAEDYDVVGLCCHIDEEHPVEAKNGVRIFFFL